MLGPSSLALPLSFHMSFVIYLWPTIFFILWRVGYLLLMINDVLRELYAILLLKSIYFVFQSSFIRCVITPKNLFLSTGLRFEYQIFMTPPLINSITIILVSCHFFLFSNKFTTFNVPHFDEILQFSTSL